MSAEQGIKKYRWLAWNPLWLLIAVAWVILAAWALQGRIAEKELARRQAEEIRSPPAAPATTGQANPQGR